MFFCLAPRVASPFLTIGRRWEGLNQKQEGGPGNVADNMATSLLAGTGNDVITL